MRGMCHAHHRQGLGKARILDLVDEHRKAIREKLEELKGEVALVVADPPKT